MLQKHESINFRVLLVTIQLGETIGIILEELYHEDDCFLVFNMFSFSENVKVK